VASQSKMGDRHVYGAKSRFLTNTVMGRLQPIVWPDNHDASPSAASVTPRIDVAGKLREMW
jgi:DNA helicase-2/ATP-dependent DNA helicase PcrA